MKRILIISITIIVILAIGVGTISAVGQINEKKNERNLFALMDEFVGTICDVATADIIESKSVYGKLNGNGNGIQYFGVVLVAKDSIKDVDSLISILDDKFEIVECWEQQDSNINSKYLEHQKLKFETDISFDDEYMSICFFNSRHPDSDFLDEAGH